MNRDGTNRWKPQERGVVEFDPAFDLSTEPAMRHLVSTCRMMVDEPCALLGCEGLSGTLANTSRRRDCHSAAPPPLPSLLKHLRQERDVHRHSAACPLSLLVGVSVAMERGRQQSDRTLADGSRPSQARWTVGRRSSSGGGGRGPVRARRRTRLARPSSQRSRTSSRSISESTAPTSASSPASSSTSGSNTPQRFGSSSRTG